MTPWCDEFFKLASTRWQREAQKEIAAKGLPGAYDSLDDYPTLKKMREAKKSGRVGGGVGRRELAGLGRGVDGRVYAHLHGDRVSVSKVKATPAKGNLMPAQMSGGMRAEAKLHKSISRTHRRDDELKKLVDIPEYRGQETNRHSTRKAPAEVRIGGSRIRMDDPMVQRRMQRDPTFKAKVQRAQRAGTKSLAPRYMMQGMDMSQGQRRVRQASDAASIVKAQGRLAGRGILHADTHMANWTPWDSKGNRRKPVMLDFGRAEKHRKPVDLASRGFDKDYRAAVAVGRPAVGTDKFNPYQASREQILRLEKMPTDDLVKIRSRQAPEPSPTSLRNRGSATPAVPAAGVNTRLRRIRKAAKDLAQRARRPDALRQTAVARPAPRVTTPSPQVPRVTTPSPQGGATGTFTRHFRRGVAARQQPLPMLKQRAGGAAAGWGQKLRRGVKAVAGLKRLFGR